MPTPPVKQKRRYNSINHARGPGSLLALRPADQIPNATGHGYSSASKTAATIAHKLKTQGYIRNCIHNIAAPPHVSTSISATSSSVSAQTNPLQRLEFDAADIYDEKDNMDISINEAPIFQPVSVEQNMNTVSVSDSDSGSDSDSDRCGGSANHSDSSSSTSSSSSSGSSSGSGAISVAQASAVSFLSSLETPELRVIGMFHHNSTNLINSNCFSLFIINPAFRTRHSHESVGFVGRRLINGEWWCFCDCKKSRIKLQSICNLKCDQPVPGYLSQVGINIHILDQYYRYSSIAVLDRAKSLFSSKS